MDNLPQNNPLPPTNMPPVTPEQKKSYPKWLIPLAAVLVLGIIAVVSWEIKAAKQLTNEQSLYSNLESMCKSGDSCCQASVDSMREGGYKLAVNNTCQEGFEVEKLRCISSFTWCRPAAQTVASSQPSDKKIYTNEKFGFEVQIPTDWTVEASGDELFFYSANSKQKNDERTLRCKDQSAKENDPMECSNKNVDMYFTSASYASGNNNKTEIINGITWTVLEGENSGLQYETRRGKVPLNFKLPLLPENKTKMVDFLSTFQIIPTTYDWKTSNNTQDGYYIQYPSDWNWQGNDLYSYFPEQYSLPRSDEVHIQIQKRMSSESSFEKEIAKLNDSITSQIDGSGAQETKIESKTVGNFTYYNKVLSGPGGAFEVYYAPGKDTKTYFVVLIWGSENQQSVVSKILSSFKPI